MDTYDATQAPRFRSALEDRARQLRAILAHETDGARSDAIREPVGFADDVPRIAEAEVGESKAAHAASELLDVDAALRRLADGSFGRCTDCGTAIDLRRLVAVPAASHCATCQAAHERP